VSLSLPALLSQALVAFTIEFDNEAERQMPHRTTNHGPTLYAPWLVSLVMYSNCMHFVGEDGVGVGELEKLARAKTNLNGMVRWGYITVGTDGVIRATPAGRKAQEVWRPLFGVIEDRWETRFGKEAIRQLRNALSALVRQIDQELPDCLPILRYGLFSRGPFRERQTAARLGQDHLPLSALLSRLLLSFAIEFERESEVSLAIGANVLRVIDENGVRNRDLPRLSGVSKEAILMALGWLRKKDMARAEPDPTGKGQLIRLTVPGRAAQLNCHRLIDGLEERWQARFGRDALRRLRALLEPVTDIGKLPPYPDGWRASLPKPATLPHYPMVLHRGGFPDGS
jgi:hypothetical protein